MHEARGRAKMAALNISRIQVSPIRSLLSPSRWTEVVVKNNYSVFPPYYIQPTFKKDKIAELQETGEAAKIAHIPIKPARSHDTSSTFHNELVRKFTNYVMRKGKKELARNLIAKAFENIKRLQLERYNKAALEDKANIETDPKMILYQAVMNCKPLLELTPIKRGGVTYQVPMPLTDRHAEWMSMQWILLAAKDKHRKVHLPEKLAWELIDAANNQGRVVKKKQELHRQCEANRAYAHYRWS